MKVLAFDTSNYTTSVAVFDGNGGKNASRLLDVAQGALGLRQSDALFAHTKRLPELADRLFCDMDAFVPDAVGASTRPRAVEGSYMPCFLAGQTQAQVISSALKIPFYAFSHQQGHIAASVWSAGRMDLLDKPHLAWHLSGGTTELLLVEPDGLSVRATKIGGTTDISAGQLIDRTGQLLELPFPSGKAIDALSKEGSTAEKFRVKVSDASFSLSGVQNKVQEFYARGASKSDTAFYVLRCLTDAIVRATENALERFAAFDVVFAGGVASNSMLRERCSAEGLPAVFCAPEFSTDNAMGTAILTWRAHNAGL